MSTEDSNEASTTVSTEDSNEASTTVPLEVPTELPNQGETIDTTVVADTDIITDDMMMGAIQNHYGLEEAIENRDLVAVADALTDLLYVVYGAGHTFGLDLDDCFDEVHASNMSKLGPDGLAMKRQDGKVLKGPNFFEPDLESILNF